MAISSDYPHPIVVNGYACRNCDDVAKAKRFEDPAQATPLPPTTEARASDGDMQRAVNFGGVLAFRNDSNKAAAAPSEFGNLYDKVA